MAKKYMMQFQEVKQMNNIYWDIQDKDGQIYRFLSDIKEELEAKLLKLGENK